MDRRSRRRTLVTMGTLITLIALMLAGCGSRRATVTPLASAQTPTPTSTLWWKFATATAGSWTPTPRPDAALHAPIAGNQAHWALANLPSGFGSSFHVSVVGIAQGYGSIAYSCSQLDSSGVLTVKTWSSGASWAHETTLNQPWDGCMGMVIDDINPNILMIVGINAWAFSRNGGQSWTLTSNPILTQASELATVGSRTFALYRNSSGESLAVSTDGLVTWHDVGFPLAEQNVSTFWVNSVTGALLMETQSNWGALTLWTSSDGGAHWTHIATPFASVGHIVAQAGTSAAPWNVCVDGVSDSPIGISCSRDSGASWHALPELDDLGLRGFSVIAIADDGAILALGSADTLMRLYRLAPDAQRWQTLGDVPPSTGFLLYARVPGGRGVLWSLPSIKGGGSGDANPTDLFSAPYPY